MSTVLTAKLKLHATPDQFHALRATQLAYRDALNYVSRCAFAHGKLSNAVALQDGTYQEIRARFGLPAQMACSVPRRVGATYKTLWTKVKANSAACAAGKTKKRYRGLDQAPKYVSPTLIYQLGHDYGFKTVQQVSLLMLEGRVIVPYTGYDQQVALIQHGARIGAAKLWHDRPHQQFYLLVSLEMEVADPTPESQRGVVGVDVGQRYLAVATDMQDHMTFYSGHEARAKADHYARLRKRLQQKGTRSAIRRLIVIAGARETVEARAQPPHQSADRDRVSAQPHRVGRPDAYP
jgi:predicted transposase